MPLSKQAAMDFVARLRPGDVAEVVTFDSRVEVLQPMTNDRALLEAAIQRMRASGSTALYNAVYIVLRQLDKVKPQTGDDVRRKVIVVLSDGEDTSSLVTFEHLLDSVKRSQTVVYTVGLGLEEPTKITRSDGEFGLRQLAQETGGRLFLPKRPGRSIWSTSTPRSPTSCQISKWSGICPAMRERTVPGIRLPSASSARTCRHALAPATTQPRLRLKIPAPAL